MYSTVQMCILYFRYTISCRYVSLWIYLCLCIILNFLFSLAATSDSRPYVICIARKWKCIHGKRIYIYILRLFRVCVCVFFLVPSSNTFVHMQNRHLYFRKRKTCIPFVVADIRLPFHRDIFAVGFFGVNVLKASKNGIRAVIHVI